MNAISTASVIDGQLLIVKAVPTPNLVAFHELDVAAQGDLDDYLVRREIIQLASLGDIVTHFLPLSSWARFCGNSPQASSVASASGDGPL